MHKYQFNLFYLIANYNSKHIQGARDRVSWSWGCQNKGVVVVVVGG